MIKIIMKPVPKKLGHATKHRVMKNWIAAIVERYPQKIKEKNRSKFCKMNNIYLIGKE